jgi:hypothetical protein
VEASEPPGAYTPGLRDRRPSAWSPGGRVIEVARVKITEAGRRALV